MSDESYLAHALPRLLHILQGSDVREIELEEGDIRVRVHRAPLEFADSPHETLPFAAALDLPEPSTVVVRSSIVGTFYRAGQPGMAPLVSEGSRVQETTVIGIIEALHVLTDVEANCDGVVVAVLATDGQPVEYNQPLLEVRPHG